jgi:hypothetical protein
VRICEPIKEELSDDDQHISESVSESNYEESSPVAVRVAQVLKKRNLV